MGALAAQRHNLLRVQRRAMSPTLKLRREPIHRWIIYSFGELPRCPLCTVRPRYAFRFLVRCATNHCIALIQPHYSFPFCFDFFRDCRSITQGSTFHEKLSKVNDDSVPICCLRVVLYAVVVVIHNSIFSIQGSEPVSTVGWLQSLDAYHCACNRRKRGTPTPRHE